MAPLVDIHCHLQDPRLAHFLPQALERAQACGVSCIVCNGTHEEDWQTVKQLGMASTFPNAGSPRIIPCFGLHPWHVNSQSEQWLGRLEEFLGAIPSGVGEIGLDRWVEPRDEAAQERAFRAQLLLARKWQRPAMIHCVRAWDWLMPILREEGPFPQGFLIHAFGGSEAYIKPIVELGGYFSCAGNLFHEQKVKQRHILLRIPEDRLLLETDAPDLSVPATLLSEPVLRHGSKILSETAHLPIILQQVAQWLQKDPGRLAEQLWLNSQRFLGPLHNT